MSQLRTVGHYLGARWRWARLRGPALARFRERHALATVNWALERSPAYRDHWAGHDPREWRTLPTVDKKFMMAHFDTFNTRGVALDRAMEVAFRGERERDFAATVDGLTVGLSSGTSGHRGLFLVDEDERDAWAGTILARALPPGAWRGCRIALFLRANSNLYETISGRRIAFRFFDLMTPIDRAAADIERFGPDVLVGPPSLLKALGERVRHVPRRVVSVAETLDPDEAERLAALWSAPVHQIYQATEGLLAVSCVAGSLHVQEDVVALQWEDAGGGRVSPIVTDLRRRTQPIIRYRLGDLLLLDDAPCPCGSPWQRIARIEGRRDDVLRFPGEDGAARDVYPDILRRAVLLAHPAIEDFRIVQDAPGAVEISLALRPGGDFTEVAESVRRSLAEVLGSYGCRAERVEVRAGLPPELPADKRRRVRRGGGA